MSDVANAYSGGSQAYGASNVAYDHGSTFGAMGGVSQYGSYYPQSSLQFSLGNIGNSSVTIVNFVNSNISVNLQGPISISFGASTINYAPPVCFAAGTMIRTPRGEVAVERLAVGDLVVTASGAHRPVRWLGHRRIRRPAGAAQRQLMLPVRIAAHAFGPGRPARDLTVSPGHALCLDLCGEVLVPASALINGATIAQLDVERVTYWHVELDSHDLLVAEGVAAESYMDAGNRPFFAEHGAVALAASPDARRDGHHGARLDEYCRPYVDGGPVVAALRARLLARAVAMGWTQAADPLAGLHLRVDGIRVAPEGAYPRVRFTVPATARDVRLVSGAAAVSDPAAVDARRLGVCLAAVTAAAADGVPRVLDLAGCAAGFHDAEAGWRWTDGEASLPSSLWSGCEGEVTLTLDLAHPSPSRWAAPTVETSASRRAAA